MFKKKKNVTHVVRDFIYNFPRSFKKYFSTNILFLTYTFTSLYMGLILRYITVGGAFHLRPFLCDLVVILIFGSFGYLFKPKNQFKYFFALSLIYTTLCVVNSIYYTFYSGFASISMASTFSMFGPVSNSVTSKLKIKYFVYLLGPLVLIIVNYKLLKKNYYFNISKTEKGHQMFIRTFCSSLVLFLMIFLTISGAQARKILKSETSQKVVHKLGIYTYTLLDPFRSLYTSNLNLGYEEAYNNFVNFYSQKDKKSINEYTDIFKGKNVLFIHAESIQNFLINLRVNGVEITPNINKIAKEGIYFSSFYPQISVGTSSDTEFTLSTGLMPSTNGTVFVNYYDRKYESIQNAFRKKGYYTFSAHANVRTYWNREEMYKTLGYDEFYAKDSFEVPEDSTSEDIVGLGLSDKSFYKQFMPILKNIKDTKELFMGTIISLSNHSPFNDVEKYGELPLSITVNKETGKNKYGLPIYENVTVPYLENTEMGNYLRSSHYSDEAFGELFKMLKDEGIMENTVVIFYGDHESKIGKREFDLLYNYDPITEGIKSSDEEDYISLDNYRYDLLKNTPLIIWTGDDSLSKEIKDVMGMWDVFPTIANMFNLNSTYALGHDIFSNNEKIVVFPTGDILTNKIYYNNLREEYISLTDEPIDIEYVENIKKYAEERMDLSKDIIKYNLMEKVIK